MDRMNKCSPIDNNGLPSSTGDLEIQLQHVSIFDIVIKCTK